MGEASLFVKLNELNWMGELRQHNGSITYPFQYVIL